MAFHDFESEFIEAAASSRSTAGAPRPATTRASNSSAPRSTTRPPSGTPGGRTTPVAGGPNTPRPTPSTSGIRPSGGATRPSPQTPPPRPAARPPQDSRRATVDWSSLQRVGGQLFDLVQGGAQAFQQAQQFANAIGLTGRTPAPAPSPAGDVGQPAGVDPGVAVSSAVPPVSPGEPPSAPPLPMQPSGAVPQPSPSGQPMPSGPQPSYGAPPPSFDQLGFLLQALQQRQIPPLPVSSVPPTMPTGQPDAFSMLRAILTNPQLQRALQSSGVAGRPSVQLPVPTVAAPRQMQQVQLPLAAVLNTIFALSGQAVRESDEGMGEEASELPSYLLGDDGNFLVDPDSPDDRAALVAHLFLVSEEAQRHFPRTGRVKAAPAPVNSRFHEADGELGECEAWARDAGIIQ
jgi:hypothetical protein